MFKIQTLLSVWDSDPAHLAAAAAITQSCWRGKQLTSGTHLIFSVPFLQRRTNAHRQVIGFTQIIVHVQLKRENPVFFAFHSFLIKDHFISEPHDFRILLQTLTGSPNPACFPILRSSTPDSGKWVNYLFIKLCHIHLHWDCWRRGTFKICRTRCKRSQTFAVT